MRLALDIFFWRLRRGKIDDSKVVKCFHRSVGAILGLFFHHNPDVVSFAVEVVDEAVVWRPEILHQSKRLSFVIGKAVFEDVSASLDKNEKLIRVSGFHVHLNIPLVVNKFLEDSCKEAFAGA